MKVLKIVGIVLGVLLLALVAGTYFLLKTVDTANIKTAVCENLNKLLDRQVTIDQMSFTMDLTKGFVLKVNGATILDSQDFSKDDFLKVREINLAVDIKSFISTRKITVSSVEVLEPKIKIIRLADGRLNIPQPTDGSKVSFDFNRMDFLKPYLQDLAFALIESTAYAEETSKDASNDFLNDLVVRLITIKQAEVTFLDKASNPALNIAVDKMDGVIKNFNFKSYFPVDLKCSLLSAQQNIFVQSEVSITSDFKKILVKDLTVNSNLANLDVAKMNTAVPAIVAMGLEKVDGQLNINVANVELNENALTKLNLKGAVKDGKLALKYLAYPIDNIDINFDMNEKNLNVPEISMYLAKGKIIGQAAVTDYLTKPAVVSSMSAQGLQLIELLEKFNLPLKVEGLLNAKFDSKLDSIDSKELMSGISGGGAINIKEGQIIDINLLNLILSNIPVFPDLMQKLSQSLPDEYKQKLSKKNTTIDQFDINLEAASGKVLIKDILLGADGILVQANGAVDFNQNLELVLNCSLKEDLSKSLVEAQEEFSYLMDSQNKINLPIRPYKGKLQDIKIVPDLAAISKQAIESKGKEELKNAIFKALDIEDKPAAETSTQPTQGQATQPQNPEKVIIENLLDSIFK